MYLQKITRSKYYLPNLQFEEKHRHLSFKVNKLQGKFLSPKNQNRVNLCHIQILTRQVPFFTFQMTSGRVNNTTTILRTMLRAMFNEWIGENLLKIE